MFDKKHHVGRDLWSVRTGKVSRAQEKEESYMTDVRVVIIAL